ncbi:MAG: RNA-binding domain-containing protein [Bacteroidota bacterium]
MIPKHEDIFTEFKSAFNTSVIETLVAFANTKGGRVYIGVNDAGKMIGVSLAQESVQQWTNEIKSKTEPSLMPDIDIQEIDGKHIVIISVIEYPIKPLSVQGRYYKRLGNSNHLMNASEVSDCYLQAMQYSWDAYIRPETGLDDLDSRRIEKFIQRLNEKGRIHLDGSNIEILRKLKLIKKDHPTNAAMLLFAKEPLMYDVHAGRLKTSDMILDDKIIRNTLFEAVEETLRYIISHLKIAYEISSETVLKTTQHTEIFEYPLEALRELVLNAIIHRKYDSSVDIQINPVRYSN